VITQEQLTNAQKRKIHNHSYAIRQRRRCYKHEIVCSNIDPGFKITTIKSILRQINVPFNLINMSTSKSTHRTTLFIGIKNSTEIRRYEEQIKNLFNNEHYKQLHRDNHRHRY
jgi:hypothetical protein